MKGKLWVSEAQSLKACLCSKNQSGKLINESFQSIHIDQTPPGGRGLVIREDITSHVH